MKITVEDMLGLVNKVSIEYSDTRYFHLPGKRVSDGNVSARLQQLWEIRTFLVITAMKADRQLHCWNESTLRFFYFQLECLERDLKAEFAGSEK